MRLYTKQDLHPALDALAFEFFHYRLFRSLLEEHGSIDQVQKQATLYALLIHLRLIVDFFHKRPQEDDLALEHFQSLVTDFKASFQHSSTFTQAEVDRVGNELNKRLAHITATRWDKPRTDFEFYQHFFDLIEAEICSFEDALPNELRQLYDVAVAAKRRNLYPIKL